MTAVTSPAPSGVSPWGQRISRLGLSGLITIVAGVVVGVVILWALGPGLFTSHDPFAGDTVERLLPPDGQHLFGTDHLGRDVFARVVYGTRSAVFTSLVAVTIGLVVGGFIGLVAGFYSGVVDAVLGRFIDVLLAIPQFLLAVIVVVSLGFATINAAIAVGISAVAVFARLARSEAIRVKNLKYIESSYLVGGGKLVILFQHVLPNAYRSVVALAVLQFGLAIIIISGLAFLGYGNPPPAADWGLLVSEGKTYFFQASWLVFLPGTVMVVTVLAINQLSRAFGKD
jgi:peptide/nickel transport system permease protein